MFVLCREGDKEDAGWGYIYRPYNKKGKGGGDEGEEKMVLSGYGIELQFKSQEYKAQDDSNVNNGKKFSKLESKKNLKFQF
jgi:hypothetical protein